MVASCQGVDSKRLERNGAASSLFRLLRRSPHHPREDSLTRSGPSMRIPVPPGPAWKDPAAQYLATFQAPDCAGSRPREHRSPCQARPPAHPTPPRSCTRVSQAHELLNRRHGEQIWRRCVRWPPGSAGSHHRSSPLFADRTRRAPMPLVASSLPHAQVFLFRRLGSDLAGKSGHGARTRVQESRNHQSAAQAPRPTNRRTARMPPGIRSPATDAAGPKGAATSSQLSASAGSCISPEPSVPATCTTPTQPFDGVALRCPRWITVVTPERPPVARVRVTKV